MTPPPELPDDRPTDTQSSLLPAADLSIRVRPADFARMVGVSKQTVSQWIKGGKVTLGPDGRLNPARACDEVLRNSDPGRLRAKVLRPLVDDVTTLRRQIQERDRRTEDLRARINYLEAFIREVEAAEQHLIEVLVPERWGSLRALAADQISVALDGLMDESLIAIGDDADPPDFADDEQAAIAVQIDALNTEADSLLLEAMRDIADLDQQGGGARPSHRRKSMTTKTAVSEQRIAEIFSGIEAMAAIAGWKAHELAVAFATCAGSLAAAAAEDTRQLECSISALHALTESSARVDFQRKGQTPVWN